MKGSFLVRIEAWELALILLVFMICSILIGSFAGKRLRTEDSEPKQYQKLAVVVLSPKTSSRAIVEDAVSGQFRAKGIKATSTFNTFPFAGKVGELDIDKEELAQKIRQKVTDNKIDALLTIVLLDQQKEQRYVEGSGITITGPVYGYGYYDYYSYAHATIYDPGYYVNTTSYFIESNLYDVASEKLLWTAQTKTEDPSSIEKEAANFAKIIVEDIVNKKVLIP